MRLADADLEGLAGFARAEAAKRRLLFELLALGLPVVGWRERDGGLALDLLSSTREPVTTQARVRRPLRTRGRLARVQRSGAPIMIAACPPPSRPPTSSTTSSC